MPFTDQQIDQWVEQIKSDQSLPELTDQELKGIYAFAHQFYTEGKYREAIHFFTFLTLFEPTQQTYWIGLGASHQLLKEFREALNAYAHAALLDQTIPEVSFYAAQCFLALKNSQDGLCALDAAETLAKKKGNQVLLTHIHGLRKKFKQ